MQPEVFSHPRMLVGHFWTAGLAVKAAVAYLPGKAAIQGLLPVEGLHRIHALGALHTLPRATTECNGHWCLLNHPSTWTF
jgi:hypothetical protein